MALTLVNLDSLTRIRMLNEFDADFAARRVYTSDRLSTWGAQDWPAALRGAIEAGSDSTLELWLSQPGRLNSQEPRNTKNGLSMVKVPITAPQTMSEGEFNRYYIRGVCLRARDEGKIEVIAYRAKQVQNPRAESLTIEGKSFNAEVVLNDLRSNVGTVTASGFPGPNSGLSVRF